VDGVPADGMQEVRSSSLRSSTCPEFSQVRALSTSAPYVRPGFMGAWPGGVVTVSAQVTAALSSYVDRLRIQQASQLVQILLPSGVLAVQAGLALGLGGLRPL
jgi:hypothetical protein